MRTHATVKTVAGASSSLLVPVCYVDKDRHLPYYTLEYWGEERLIDVSACRNPEVRYQRVLLGDAKCSYTTSEFECCIGDFPAGFSTIDRDGQCRSVDYDACPARRR